MSGTALVRYDAMCSAIAAAYAVDEVKDIRNKARAIETYARQAKNVEAERQACEIRLRAERKAGELLRERDKAKGARGSGSNQHEVRSHHPTAPPLSDLGISKQQSSDWQKLAAVPSDLFEKELQSERPTTNGIIAAHSQPEAKDKVGAGPLWLWGRLKDFERDGLLDLDPNEVVEEMLGHMQTTVKQLAPRVAAWLARINP